MTIASTTSKLLYNGDGSTTVFAISFIFWQSADLKVVHRDANGAETTWVEGTQYTVLAHIFVHGPISLSKVAEIMHVDRTTLARNLAPLERKGLVEINAGSDKRAKIINISENGKEILIKALPLWKKTQEKIKKTLGIDNWESMITNLSGLVSEIE